MYNNLIIAKNLSINLKRKIDKQHKNIAFVCIGTNNVIGDSIGPRVGSYLKSTTNLEVFGDLKNNICKKEDIETIHHKLKNKYVIAIDSAISNNINIGEICITEKKLQVGYGMNFNKGAIGDISVKVVVAKDTNDVYKNFLNLKNADLKMVQNLAFTVGNGIRYIWGQV